MKQGDFYLTRTGIIIVVVSSNEANATDHPSVSGMHCDTDPESNMGAPYTVPAYLADDQVWVQTMTVSPWRKHELAPLGRSLNPEELTAVLTALARILSVEPTRPQPQKEGP